RIAVDDRAVADLRTCVVAAKILAGDLDAAERSMKDFEQRWPIDLRQWGGDALTAELLLYRGRYAAFEDRAHTHYTTQLGLAEALWQPAAVQPFDPPPPPKPDTSGGVIK